MSGLQNIITQRSRIKQPQYIAEGLTPATYGVTPSTPSFTAIGCNAILTDNGTPNTAEQRQSGNPNRVRKDFISHNNTMSIKFQMTLLDVNLLQWATSIPTISTNTPDESRTFFDSYTDVDATEIFRKFLGCKPISWTFSEDRTGYINVEISCSCKQIIESSTAFTSPSYASANTNAPYTHRDAGALPFLYNSVAFSSSNFTFSGTLTQATQDAHGSDTTLWATPTQRTVSGSISIYKKNADLQNLARLADETNDAVYTFDSANSISIVLNNFLWLPSTEELSGDDATATMENKSYEATNASVVDA